MFGVMLSVWMSLAVGQEVATPVGPPVSSDALIGFAPLPSEARIKRLSAGDYNDLLVGDEFRMFEHVIAEMRLSQYNRDQAAHTAFYMQIAASVKTATVRVASIPPFKKDPSLRDSLVASYEEWLALVEAELAAMPQMYAVVHNDAEMSEYEAIRVPLDARWVARDRGVADAQLAFAQRHRLQLHAPERSAQIQAFQDFQPFAASGLPPTGSKLLPQIWVNVAIDHHNAVVHIQNALVGFSAGILEVDEATEVEAIRQESILQIRILRAELDTFGPLAGDDAWVASVRAFADWQLAHFEDEWVAYVTAAQRKRLRAKDVSFLNQIANDFLDGANSHVDQMEAQRVKFSERFAMDAYDQWDRERQKVMEATYP